MAINHIGLVTADLQMLRRFLEHLLRASPHAQEDWFILPNSDVVIHIIEIEDAVRPSNHDMHHYYRHIAVEVEDIRTALSDSLKLNLAPFQMDMEGNEHIVESPSDSLSHGLRTLFVRDYDGNLWEFLQRGHSASVLFK